jgi:hypothetical protein
VSELPAFYFGPFHPVSWSFLAAAAADLDCTGFAVYGSIGPACVPIFPKTAPVPRSLLKLLISSSGDAILKLIPSSAHLDFTAIC